MEFGKAELRVSQMVAAAGANVAAPDSGAPIVPVQAKPQNVKSRVISVPKVKLEQADDVVMIGADEDESPSD